MNRGSVNQGAQPGALNSVQRSQSTSQSQSQPQSQQLPSSSNSTSTSTPYPPATLPLNSNRTSPFGPTANKITTTSAATTNPTVTAPTPAPATTAPMAASILPPIYNTLTQPPSHASPFARFPDREVPTHAGSSPEAPLGATVVIRGLLPNVDEQTVKTMCTFSTELTHVELAASQDDDASTRSAILVLKSLEGAHEVKNTLHGKNGLAVDILAPLGQTSGPPSSGASSATSPAVAATQAPRFDAVAFASLDRTSPPTGNYMRNGNSLSYPESNYGYMNMGLFSPQSPIGNHLSDQPRVSGKSLINDAPDDDDTGDILKDPRAYAENGPFPTQRRSTVAHLPIARLANLSLNTSTNGMHAPQHGHSGMYQPASAHSTTMSPTGLNAAVGGYQPSYTPWTGRALAPPPANPSDMNPPCNTLYVGNLPMDASEDELRRLFQPQRGYRRMCYRTKTNGPMCFVEFEDVGAATRALNDLYGVQLTNSKKGGIRLSFSKNPLGVRTAPAPGQGPAGSLAGPNGMPGHSANGFAAAAGPPPGFSSMPPGLPSNRSASAYTPSTISNGAGLVNGNSSYQPPNNNGSAPQGFAGVPHFTRDPWSTSSSGYFNTIPATSAVTSLAGSSNGLASVNTYDRRRY